MSKRKREMIPKIETFRGPRPIRNRCVTSGKVKFPELADAEAAMLRWGINGHAYLCTFCEFHHFTSQP